MGQKTKVKVNRLVSANTLEKRWVLVYSFEEEKQAKQKGNKLTYVSKFNKLWKLTGISKQTYDYDEMINYGRKESY